VELVARVVRACRTTLKELTLEGFGPLSEGVARGLIEEEKEDEDMDEGVQESSSSSNDQKKEQQQLSNTVVPVMASAAAPHLHRLRLTLVLFEAPTRHRRPLPPSSPHLTATTPTI